MAISIKVAHAKIEAGIRPKGIGLGIRRHRSGWQFGSEPQSIFTASPRLACSRTLNEKSTEIDGVPRKHKCLPHPRHTVLRSPDSVVVGDSEFAELVRRGARGRLDRWAGYLVRARQCAAPSVRIRTSRTSFSE